MGPFDQVSRLLHACVAFGACCAAFNVWEKNVASRTLRFIGGDMPTLADLVELFQIAAGSDPGQQTDAAAAELSGSSSSMGAPGLSAAMLSTTSTTCPAPARCTAARGDCGCA